ncbi:hypothetical protein KAU30_03205 [Candidatus Bathyarchaeota archaeon]|nr:hypothetical protein [Candidatus Bathyarchaeota archaeon]
MNEKEKMSIKGYVLLGVIILFFIISILITWRLFTAEYPTHSDVFFMGVECGVLVVVLLVCLFLVCLVLYRLAVLLYTLRGRTLREK